MMKTAAGGNNLALKGAVFSLYAGRDCCVNSKIADESIPAEKLTTATSGKLSDQILLKAGEYSVKEVKAPLGYLVSGSCKNITIASSDTSANPQTYALTNEKSDVPALPLTGAQGQTLLLAAGGTLLMGGAAVVILLRRKKL